MQLRQLSSIKESCRLKTCKWIWKSKSERNVAIYISSSASVCTRVRFCVYSRGVFSYFSRPHHRRWNQWRDGYRYNLFIEMQWNGSPEVVMKKFVNKINLIKSWNLRGQVPHQLPTKYHHPFDTFWTHCYVSKLSDCPRIILLCPRMILRSLPYLCAVNIIEKLFVILCIFVLCMLVCIVFSWLPDNLICWQFTMKYV